jgi:hypothetical protein
MLAVAGFAGLLVGCDSILKVSNPEQIPVASLDDSTLINAQVAGVISEFQDAYTRNNGAWLWSANFLTDEQVTGLNWEDYARVNQRVIRYTEGPIASRARRPNARSGRPSGSRKASAPTRPSPRRAPPASPSCRTSARTRCTERFRRSDSAAGSRCHATFRSSASMSA